MTLLASSTTQTSVGSRRGSAQIGQRGPSERLKQFSQKRIRSRSSDRAETREATSAGSTLSRCSANRCAVFLPTPGSFASSEIRRSIGGASCATPRSAQPRQLQAGRQPLRFLLNLRVHAAARFVDRGQDEVLEHAGVVRGDRLGGERQRDELLATVHPRRHGAASRRGLDLEDVDLVLELRLHALEVLHHFLDVHALSSVGGMSRAGRTSTRCAPNSPTSRWIAGSPEARSAKVGAFATGGPPSMRTVIGRPSVFAATPSTARTLSSPASILRTPSSWDPKEMDSCPPSRTILDACSTMAAIIGRSFWSAATMSSRASACPGE